LDVRGSDVWHVVIYLFPYGTSYNKISVFPPVGFSSC